jgi:hypothetical protein
MKFEGFAALAWSSRLHEVMGAERENGGKRIAGEDGYREQVST